MTAVDMFHLVRHNHFSCSVIVLTTHNYIMHPAERRQTAVVEQHKRVPAFFNSLTAAHSQRKATPADKRKDCHYGHTCEIYTDCKSGKLIRPSGRSRLCSGSHAEHL